MLLFRQNTRNSKTHGGTVNEARTLKISPIHPAWRALDCLVTPILILIFGKENVHSTRPWHIHLATLDEISYLDRKKMVLCGPLEKCDQQPSAKKGDDSGGTLLANYIVLTAKDEDLRQGLFIGWIMLNESGYIEIHQRVIHAPVRVIIGPYGMMFFGIRPKTGEQVQIYKVGNGHFSIRNPEHEKLIRI